MIVNYFPGAKIADMNHYKNPTREKSPAATIIHRGANGLSITKYPNTMQTILCNLPNQLRLTQTN